MVPRNARIGTEVPLSLSMEGESSNTVGVAIDSAPSSITIDGLSVRLAWDASTSSVIGYNVYRATTSGGPYTKLNSNVVTGTGYTDETLTAGQTYHYVVKSVSALNLESVASNEASAVVPVP
jgi:fibronectin type 3 domain-containing protein